MNSQAVSSSETPSLARRSWGPWLVYAAMLLVSALIFAGLRHIGETLTPQGVAWTPQGTGPVLQHDLILHVLLALAVIIATGRVLGALCTRIGQPRVIGEVVGGILLGPSLLGRIWPEGQAFLFPTSIHAAMGILSQLGVILYMFLVGLELNAGLLRQRAHATLLISHASMLLPFLSGATLALALYPTFAPHGVPFTSFALFLGVAMSVTAFPVLARILSDRGLETTPLGIIALGCAAADDVTAWCLLSFVVGVTQAELSQALGTLLLTFAYILLMFLIVRPLGQRLLARTHERELSPSLLAGALICVLLSAFVTEWIGIHALFGAFLLGAIIPHDSTLARGVSVKVEELVTILLLPAFFANTGVRTQIGLVYGWENLAICGLIIVVATAGKLGGAALAARLSGLDTRSSLAVGVLMNTRGLMELIVLNVGLDLGVISPTLFVMLVLMALVTTMTTSPGLILLGIKAESTENRAEPRKSPDAQFLDGRS